MVRGVISIVLATAGSVLLGVTVAQTPDPHWTINLVPWLWCAGGVLALLEWEKD